LEPVAFRLDGSTLAGGRYLLRVTGEEFAESRLFTLMK
jgi:hypothetical protein